MTDQISEQMVCDICNAEIPAGVNHVTVSRLIEWQVNRVTRRGDIKVVDNRMLDAEVLETRCMTCDRVGLPRGSASAS